VGNSTTIHGRRPGQKAGGRKWKSGKPAREPGPEPLDGSRYRPCKPPTATADLDSASDLPLALRRSSQRSAPTMTSLRRGGRAWVPSHTRAHQQGKSPSRAAVDCANPTNTSPRRLLRSVRVSPNAGRMLDPSIPLTPSHIRSKSCERVTPCKGSTLHARAGHRSGQAGILASSTDRVVERLAAALRRQCLARKPVTQVCASSLCGLLLACKPQLLHARLLRRLRCIIRRRFMKRPLMAASKRTKLAPTARSVRPNGGRHSDVPRSATDTRVAIDFPSYGV
jgi:hypothetical protein